MPVTYRVKTITPDEALELMHNGATVLDPITPEAFECHHIKGAINVCVYEVAFMAKVPELLPDKTVPIIVYSNTATSHESLAAAQKLEQLGYTSTYVVQGGIKALLEAGCDSEGSDGSLDEQLQYTFGSYTAVTQNSLIEWSGRNINGKHRGTVGLKEGSLIITDDCLQGSITVDMTDIINKDLTDASYAQMLIAHLCSDDFFSVKIFPEANFTIHSAQRSLNATASSVNHTLHGSMSLCGITKPLDVPATLIQSNDTTLILEAHFDFDRTLWGISYGSARFFRFLGMHMIFDPISIEVRIELKRH